MYEKDLFYLLHIHESFIESILCHERIVCTAFNDLSFLQYNDLIGMADGAQPVGNDDAGEVGHHFIDSVLYQSFAFGIEGGSGLVEN